MKTLSHYFSDTDKWLPLPSCSDGWPYQFTVKSRRALLQRLTPWGSPLLFQWKWWCSEENGFDVWDMKNQRQNGLVLSYLEKKTGSCPKLFWELRWSMANMFPFKLQIYLIGRNFKKIFFFSFWVRVSLYSPSWSEQTMLVSNSNDLPASAYQLLGLHATMLSSVGSSFQELGKGSKPSVKVCCNWQECQLWHKTTGLGWRVYLHLLTMA